ncbi:OLC1v1023165C1 [Oldenlandia corymbosa var. corymbosa]|uniref:OLC1v1023165C1 n=1 Tax=Oldenlandia corymbosa var. corymbosa TaxID=529605 RepID=A0AAV1C0R1_OLDCO|nr:OLC1v1023165C1 [Oldenlandia corymbosa var. corymbosa]
MDLLRTVPAKPLHLLPELPNLNVQIKMPNTRYKPACPIRALSNPNFHYRAEKLPAPAVAVAKSEPLLTVAASSLQSEPGFLLRNRWLNLENPAVGENGELSTMNYLRQILLSKVYDVARESELELATKLSERIGNKIWLKREDLQPCLILRDSSPYSVSKLDLFIQSPRSLYMMAKLPKEKLDGGVISASSGNHAQGVALAAETLGCDAVIVMPVTTPDVKFKQVQQLGAKVFLVGDSYDEAKSYAKNRALKECRTFIPAYDPPDVISGQGTVGMEILRQVKDTEGLHAVFVPVGGGGLIAGIAAYLKSVCPQIKIIGVEAFDSNAMALSLHHGRRVVLDQIGGFVGGVRTVGEETFRLCKDLTDGVVLVHPAAVLESIQEMFEETRNILEPAGALAIAGAEAYCKYYGLNGENVVAITSSANLYFDRQRLAAQLTKGGLHKEAEFARIMPEEPGSFKRFCELVDIPHAVLDSIVCAYSAPPKFVQHKESS